MLRRISGFTRTIAGDTVAAYLGAGGVLTLVVSQLLPYIYPEKDQTFERFTALGASSIVISALLIAWHASGLLEQRLGWVIGQKYPFVGDSFVGQHKGRPTLKALFRVGVEKLGAKGLEGVRITVDGSGPILKDTALQVQGEDFGTDRLDINGTRPRYFDVLADMWFTDDNTPIGVFFEYAATYKRNVLFPAPRLPFEFLLVAEAKDMPSATLKCRAWRIESGELRLSFEETEDSSLRAVAPEEVPAMPPQTSAGAA